MEVRIRKSGAKIMTQLLYTRAGFGLPSNKKTGQLAVKKNSPEIGEKTGFLEVN